ncbi:pyridine nucleotide-disulfide oxidoreductase [Chitinophaga caeni]|uniref:Pyridine nucleotide-disulfide oxidoreductase n=1 Tax=Chitinophaga caeni TaxID=2029983 RepID=A0A291QUI3_9BACT|nr:NAD(P)/FAD-dependent oxidoreductase [Chitinophaga caeni]ATL47595.1 pyridine nucleotide-disulfide oxidoreductase [Chitinophaga caeni]
MQIEHVDVLVIGAGPSGSVAAAILRKAGLDVRIVEKMKFPRFVIGESLLPRCMEALDDAGLINAIESKSFQKKYGAKFVKNGAVCDFTFKEQHTTGWTYTWQVQRADFDKTLADATEQMGVKIDYETTVTHIEFNGSDSVTTVVDAKGAEKKIAARFIVDGSGYGRVIPKLFGLDKPSSLLPRKTLFSHIKDLRRSMADEPNRITAVVHQPGTWIWIIPFSTGLTSVGFVGEPSFFEQFDGNPDQRFRAMLESEPHTKERFRDMEFAFEPKTLEAWSASTEKFYGEGFVLTGNVTEFLDPIFSSGVTLATVSSQTAAHLVIKKLKGETVDWEKEYMEPTMQGVNVFRSYVMAWYEGTLDKIFFSKNPNPAIKQQICSVLAGYVWDQSNPFVAQHDTALKRLARTIELTEKINEE